jgi:hypothetical protein
MDARTASDGEQTHFDSVRVDLHAHPSLHVSLFHLFNGSFLCRLLAGVHPSRQQQAGLLDGR